MNYLKNITTLFALIFGITASAQITTIPDENIDPSDSLEIIFDPAGLDLAVAPQDALKQAIDAGEDVFIWCVTQRLCWSTPH